MPGFGEVSIRAAGLTDAAELAALLQAAFAQYRDRLQPAPSALKETAASIGERLTRERALAGEAEGRIVGCVFMTLRDSEESYMSAASRSCRAGKDAASRAG